MTQPRLFYGGVFVVSLCLMSLQILQSRIFSVTTWYHLAFLVISIAMFGMTLAALNLHRGDAEVQRRNYARMMAKSADDLGLFIIIALLAQMFIPIVYETFQGTALTLPILSFFTVLPYYKAGTILTLALTRAPYPVARTYGVDLVGAAAGCLLALLLMRLLDGPSAILLVAILALLSSLCFARLAQNGYKSGNAFFLIAVAAWGIIMNTASDRPFLYPVWIKSHVIHQSALAHDEWNAISRVTLDNEMVDTTPRLWGPSNRTPDREMKASYYLLKIDGDAATPITRFSGDTKDLRYLEHDVTTIAYALPGIEKVGVIGVGGGRDVLTALYHGARDITALDVNDIQIRLLTQTEPFRTYAGLSGAPGLKLVHSEARSWFSRNRESFDLVQMSLIDTWAATGAGAFALSENGLYTVEGWRTILNDLDENGIFTVSRWYVPLMKSELERLLALAVETLLESGVENPADHIFVASGGNIATLVLSKSAFTPDGIKALKKRAQHYLFGIIVSPDRESGYETFREILAARTPDDIRRLSAQSPFDIAPPHDSRPFFFNQMRIGRPWDVVKFIHKNKGMELPGQAQATLNLYIILAFSLLMVVFAILRPLRGAIQGHNERYIAAGTAWFLLIGLGFMLLEVALLQRMSIFLGHPVYGLGIVLFSLVLSTGIGSLLSEKFPLDTQNRRRAWILTASTLAAVLAFAIGPVFALFAQADLLPRAALCIALAAPLGLLLGFGFPTGMTMVKAIDDRPAPWFWGINGAAGVMGSAVAVTLNIACGLTVTIVLGGLCYALLLIPAAIMDRLPKKAL